jgi:hypothetical protein
MEYENVIQKFLFGNAVLTVLISGIKYDVIPQNGDCSRKAMCALWFCHGSPDNNLEYSVYRKAGKLEDGIKMNLKELSYDCRRWM